MAHIILRGFEKTGLDLYFLELTSNLLDLFFSSEVIDKVPDTARMQAMA